MHHPPDRIVHTLHQLWSTDYFFNVYLAVAFVCKVKTVFYWNIRIWATVIYIFFVFMTQLAHFINDYISVGNVYNLTIYKKIKKSLSVSVTGIDL